MSWKTPTGTEWANPYLRVGMTLGVIGVLLVICYIGVEFTLYPRYLWLWNSLYYAALAAIGGTVAIFLGLFVVLTAKKRAQRRGK
jgi:hypothetical protein